MTYSKNLGIVFVALTVCLLLAFPLAAAEPATVEIGSDVVFAPNASGSLRLTVNGPDRFRFDGTFGPGEAAVFTPYDKDGHALADGVYNWELRLFPSEKLSREEGDLAGTGIRGRVQSGAFSIAGGSILDPQIPETLTKDEVFHDDLIVDGAACIGTDCADGESFGYDTLHLKENNLRIKFVDTSTSVGFATNDWQITANDQTFGGQSRFSIEDIDGGRVPFTIEAGAPNHSLYVEDGGFVGVGTSTPITDVHVRSGNTPTLRLEQDGSHGFIPQTWDVAGNESQFFVRDVTYWRLPFRIKSGAPANSIYVDRDGDIGLGTDSPDANVDVEAEGPTLRMTNTGEGGGTWDLIMNENNGRLTFNHATASPLKIDPAAQENLFQLGINGSDRVDITGNLVVSGTVTPDYVFESDYDLESLEEHAAFMWHEKHLPAVAPAATNAAGQGLINVGARSQGMLEEIEKAHIYIEQLHQRLERLEQLLGGQAQE